MRSNFDNLCLILLDRCNLSSRRGSLFSGKCCFAGAAGAGKIYGTDVTEEGIEDRVYRLHYNAGQNRTDKFAAVKSHCRLVQDVLQGFL